MTDVPLIKAAKLWARVSVRTGATYLTGRWGGCRVLVFENLERKSEAEPSHFLFLGEAGEWPIPDQTAAPSEVAEPAQEVTELQAAPAAPAEDGTEEKPARRRRKTRMNVAVGAARKARKRREGLERLGVPPAAGRGGRACGGQGRAVHRGPARRHRAGVRRRADARDAPGVRGAR